MAIENARSSAKKDFDEPEAPKIMANPSLIIISFTSQSISGI